MLSDYVKYLMDKFIPIVGFDGLPIFKEICDKFRYAIIPYYEVYKESNLLKDSLSLCKDTTFILSSIMPDKYLVDPTTEKDFRQFALKLNIKYLIVWDLPTYLEKYEESERNSRASLSYIDKFRRDFHVIPLIKGAYPEHIQYSCDEIAERRFNVIAFHISEYLYSRLKPWPYIKDYSLTSYDYMLQLLNIILEYPFKEILLIGGAGPRYYKKLLEIDERIRLAGYSWFIDGSKYRLYRPDSKVINIRDKFYLCNCEVCKNSSVSILRSNEHISLHNLLMNKHLIEEPDSLNNIRTKIYDLILDTYEDMMIVNELRVGDPYSRWEEAFQIIDEYRPKYLIIMGKMLSLEKMSTYYNELKKFVEILTKIEKETGIFYLDRYLDRDVWIERLLNRLYFMNNEDIVKNKMKLFDEEHTLEKLTRLILTVKNKMRIRKLTWEKPIDIYIRLYGPAEKDYKIVLEELRNINKDDEWLITDYLNKPYIDYDRRVATPGEWHTLWEIYEKPEPGVLYLDRKGEFRLL
ncbi:MAG TPA: hypothetical protein ENG40_00115 [Thermoprotei archaeon]|nr:hypothetical protein [Thermoprotei archaeon]